MALLYDPFYPFYVTFPVSQSIWDLHQIYVWQIVLLNLGKIYTFLRLQYRYEKKHRERPALIFLIIVFAISYIIVLLMKWRELRINAINRTLTNGLNDGNDSNDSNANNTNDTNSDGQQTTTGNTDQKKNENPRPEEGNDSNQTSEQSNN